MKDVQQGTVLLVSGVDTDTRMLPDITDSSVSPLSDLNRVVLAKTPSTQAMRNEEDFASLWQQITQIVSVNHDLEPVLVDLAAVLGQAFQGEGCTIALPDGQIAYWHCDHGQNFKRIQPIQAAFEAVTDSEPTLVPNAETLLIGEDNKFRNPLIQLWKSVGLIDEDSISTCTGVGITTQLYSTVNGLISLVRSRSHQWTKAEINRLQTLSQLLAIILSQLQLKQQLTKQSQHQGVVNQLTMALRNGSDLQKILQLATHDTAKALKVQRGILLRLKYWEPLLKGRFQENVAKVRVTIACEWQESTANTLASESAQPLNQSFWMSECALCHYALNHPHITVNAADWRQLPKIDPTSGIASVFKPAEMPALLLASLESQGTVLGFLAFQRSQPYVWQPEEIELVKLVSAQVSTAIIQTETLRQVQALVEKRTAELQQSLSVQAKLYERTRQQLDQLRRLNQLKDEFLSTVSHELRTPLTSMTMAIRMLRQTGLSNDRSARYLDILEQQCAQETSLINDLLALQELESEQISIQLEEINLNQLISDLVISFNQKWSSKELTLVIDLPEKPLRLRSDRDSLNRILVELLLNAGKYSNLNSQIHLSITHKPDQPSDKLVLTLTNTGPGISPEELPFIFDKFRRCQGATQNAIQGTGLGLALVKSLVQLLNGTIDVTSCQINNTQSWETRFTLTLPQSFDGAIP